MEALVRWQFWAGAILAAVLGLAAVLRWIMLADHESSARRSLKPPSPGRLRSSVGAGGSRRGYTLLETAVALALGGLLLTLALASWDVFVRERRVVQAAEDIAGVLRFAQQAAVANSVDACRYRVAVSSTLVRAEAYAMARDDTTGACTSPTVLIRVRVTDRFPRGVSVVDTTIEFSSEGRLASNTRVSIGVSAGDRARYVHVEPLTGRVDVGTTP